MIVLLLLLALWRYMEQRFKATNQAYWCVITLVARSGRIALARKAPAAKNLTHAGGVVFRTSTFGPTEYLLVEASKDPSQWVLPKGHIDEGEHPRESAIREVHEETGVWARIQGDLNRVSYTVDGTVITVQYYLMEAVARGKALDTDRGHLWMPLDEAIKQASFLETRELLQTADQRRGTKARLAQR